MAAWQGLSPEEQASYMAAAQEKFEDAGTASSESSEKQPDDSSNGCVTYILLL